jgi:hypothetical protein
MMTTTEQIDSKPIFSTLSSLAFLKVNWDLNKSGYLDNFLPLVYEVLQKLTSDPINFNELQNKIVMFFGIRLPIHVLTSLLIRASNKKVVFRNNYQFYRSPDVKVDTNFKEIQESVCNIYNNIITKFCIYSKGLPNVSLTSEEAEQLLLSFLNYNQLDLYGSTSELVLPNLAGLSDQQRFLVGSFINIVVNNDPKIKEDFNTIIVGYMLANAIFLPDQNNLQAKFHGTSFYFDTSFYYMPLDTMALHIWSQP